MTEETAEAVASAVSWMMTRRHLGVLESVPPGTMAPLGQWIRGRVIRGSGEETAMCWNCGCMMPDNDMGNPDNITTETIRAAATAGGNRSVHDVMENLERTYKALVRNTPADSEPIV